MRIYLAAKYSRMADMVAIARVLKTDGHTVTSQWITGKEEDENMTPISRAIMDVSDVNLAEILVFFAEPRGSLNRGGGRHWEFGYAYAHGKPCIVVGEEEQVFCSLPNVVRVPDVRELRRFLSGTTGC